MEVENWPLNRVTSELDLWKCTLNLTKLLQSFLYNHHIKENYLKWDVFSMQVMVRFGGAEMHILYVKLRLFHRNNSSFVYYVHCMDNTSNLSMLSTDCWCVDKIAFCNGTVVTDPTEIISQLIIMSTAGRHVPPFYLPRRLHRAKVSTLIGLMLQLWMNLWSGVLDKIDELEWRGDIKQWTSDKEENPAHCAQLAMNSLHTLFSQACIGWEMV